MTVARRANALDDLYQSDDPMTIEELIILTNFTRLMILTCMVKCEVKVAVHSN